MHAPLMTGVGCQLNQNFCRLFIEVSWEKEELKILQSEESAQLVKGSTKEQ